MKALWIKIVLLAVALPGVWGNVAAQVTISADFDTGSIGSVRRIDSVRMLHAAKNSLEVMSLRNTVAHRPTQSRRYGPSAQQPLVPFSPGRGEGKA
ncbi:MAG: hypothetical protein ACLURY_05340 [Alistipes putredinis]